MQNSGGAPEPSGLARISCDGSSALRRIAGIQKLAWFRAGGDVSDRQWRDARGVLKAQAQLLDRAALRHWAAVLGIGDLLDRALREAGV
jgi:hypothetical protein